ncbi:MAG: FHA domain-containing protein [Acidobacteria bacterium]|nr:MAG: FHA domain-containing protein [Acidobacteriota bacterium]
MTRERRCPKCGGPLGPEGCRGECATRGSGRAKTVMVAAKPAAGRVATPEPAGEELARVPLPGGWEIVLDVVEGPDSGASFPVTRSRVLIGRGAVDISLKDRKVSRRHASLEVYGGNCVLLKDLGSTNGTYVNGQRVSAVELQDGDEIRVGSTRVTVTIAMPPAG